MKSIGLVRKLDDLGRIVLPMELRRTWNIQEGDPMEILIDGETIILRKYEPACHFCNDAKDVLDFKGKKICKKCISDIKA